MTNCYSEGPLRAYLDAELPALEQAAVGSHLAGCAACQADLAVLAAHAQQVASALSAPVVAVAPALARLHTTLNNQPNVAAEQAPVATPTRFDLQRSKPMQTTPRPAARRRWVTLAAGLVVVLSLFALPPVRAAADQLLSVFRVQNVVFLPINRERLDQLENLNFDGESLFVDKTSGEAPKRRNVGSAGDAAAAVGFTPAAVTALPQPASSTRYTVSESARQQVQLNIATARQVLAQLNITDVTLPDALGSQPIGVDIAPTVETQYDGGGYSVRLYQGRSPTVTLPPGTDLQQVGRAFLRVLGTEPATADALSRQIDWSTTFVFPFPSNMRDVRTVMVGNQQGLLIGGNSTTWSLYWQRGDRFYVLQASGMDDAEVLVAAASVQ